MIKKVILAIMLPCFMMANVYSTERTDKVSNPSLPTGRAFQHLEVGLTAGTTGIGFDLATPLSGSIRLRAGYTFVPQFTLSMKFGVGIEEDAPTLDENGNPIETESKFDKMAAIVEGLTGSTIRDEVTMLATPSMHNFKLLVDIHPFKNKRWYFTGGIYAGTSVIGRVCNSAEDMPTLYAANMFNNMYDKALEDEPVISWNGMDLYAGPALLEYGRMGFAMGQRADGTTYKMEPSEYCMVSVEAHTNAIKPYLGFGYAATALGKEARTNVSVDCGLLFWGGAPDLITHDGTNLTHDITGIEGRIGQYVNIARRFTAYPVISIGVSYLLFQR